MENNSTETKKITDKERIQILAANLMQPAEIITQYGVRWKGHLTFIDFNRYAWPNALVNVSVNDTTSEVVSGRDFQVTLLKKPLGRISDEDAKTIFKLDNPGWETLSCNETDQINIGKNLSEMMIERTMPEWIKIIDFLRSRGYALPYGQWSVEELVEFGIFKLID